MSMPLSKTSFVTAIAGAILIADQLSKWYIRRTFDLFESIPVIDGFFRITYARNTGGAFSLLADAGDGFRVPFFLIASLIAIAALLLFLRQTHSEQRLLLAALAGVLGGALGNLVDRVVAGRVTDFLDFSWHGYHWPAFNVADSCITVGVVILVAHSLFARDSRGD